MGGCVGVNVGDDLIVWVWVWVGWFECVGGCAWVWMCVHICLHH